MFVFNFHKDVKWNTKWFEKSMKESPSIKVKKFIKDMSLSSLRSQKKFLDSLGKKLGVHEARDWGKITWREVKREGGSKLLSRYGGSLKETLKTIYSGNDL